MQTISTVTELQNLLNQYRKERKSIGFVPTMGALHQGHLSLIKTCRKQAEVTVCSIFVNPTQFNDASDFEKYPITMDADVQLLESSKCSILFAPSVKEVYPNGVVNTDKLDFGYIATILEGEMRPGHFDGMAQVVERLLRIVQPDLLFMGQKDYQQFMIVQKLIELKQLKTTLIVRPIVREADGLAMSSRNVRLDAASRMVAVELSKTLQAIKRKWNLAAKNTSLLPMSSLEQWGMKRLSKFPAIELDYLSICDAETLQPITQITLAKKAVILIAAKIGGVRLIDNGLL